MMERASRLKGEMWASELPPVVHLVTSQWTAMRNEWNAIGTLDNEGCVGCGSASGP